MSTNVPLRTVYAYDLLNAQGIGQRADAAVEQALRSGQIVGGQIRIALDGQVIYRRDAGILDRATHAPVTAESIFRLSCLSRLLVSIAALALVEHEQLYLDEDIRRWLPDFNVLLADGSPATITVRQLLSHCAGFARRLPAQRPGTDYQDASIADDAHLHGHLHQLCATPLRHRPGSAWGYSMASDVLGAVVAQRCGGSLQQALRQHVIGPLRLRSIDFDAVGEQRPGPVFVNGRPIHPIRDGMLGNASDYLQLLEALRQGGGGLLSKVMVGEMAAVQTGDLPLQGWPGRGFGLGFTLLRDPLLANSPESIGTWRMESACGHAWFVDPLKRLTGVAFTNTAVKAQDPGFAVALRNAVYGV